MQKYDDFYSFSLSLLATETFQEDFIFLFLISFFGAISPVRKRLHPINHPQSILYVKVS
jgi:hypothetical protein